MIIRKSSALWDHVPTLEELRLASDPESDITVAEFPDEVNIDLYLQYTGLRIFTNGKNRYKSEMKYRIFDNGEIDYPEYDIPTNTQFILT